MAMFEDLADFAVEYAQKLGVSYAEARLEHYRGNAFVLKNSILEESAFAELHGIGIRFIQKNTLGFLSINDFKKDVIRKLLDRAIKITSTASRIKYPISLSNEQTVVKEYSVKQKINLLDTDPGQKISWLLDLDKAILNTKVNVPGRFLSYSDGVKEKYFVNSEGTKIKSIIPRIGFYYLLTIEEGGQSIQRYWQYGVARGWEGIKESSLIEKAVNEVLALQKNLKEGVKAPTGEIDVVVAPEVTGIMVHESVGHPYEADRIFGREAAQAGESFVTPEMIGKQIGSEIVTVVDDPTLENSYGFYLYDDEGVAARRKFLMKNGKINEFLHNRETAASMGISSNASSRASAFDKEAIVRMSNTFMLPGDFTEEELIEGVRRGVYIKNFMEWNIDDRRWNQKYVGSEAYLIENGRLSKPVKNPTIEITTAALYSSIDAIGKNIEWHAGTCGKGEPMQGVPVWMGGPSIRLRALRLI